MGRPLTLRVQIAVCEGSMPASARHLVHVLATYANSKTGTGWHGQETLARLSGLSVRQVRMLLAELGRRSDWPVRVVRRRRGRPGGGRSSDEYRLELVSQPAQPAGSDPSQEAAGAGSDDDPNRQNLTAQPAEFDSSTGSVCRGSAEDLRSDLRSTPASPGSAGFELTPPDSSKAKNQAAKRKPKRQPGKKSPPVTGHKRATNGKTKPERSAEERAAHTKLTETYFAAYERCTGQKPPFGSRDGKAVWKLFDDVGLDRGELALRNAFGDEWGKRRSIRSVADDPAKFLASPKPAGRAGGRHVETQQGLTAEELAAKREQLRVIRGQAS